MERMLAGLSTRRYRTGLEPVGEQVEATATATSKSAVSRRFVAATETALAELMGADLSGLDLVAFLVDGVHVAESCCVVALGIGLDGTKHPLAVEEGSTENATLVTDLLVGLRERGLDVTRPVLAVLDGSKALRRAVLDVFDGPSDPTLSTAQDPEREGQVAGAAAYHRRAADARGLPGRVGAGRRGAAGGAGQRAGQDPSRCGGQPARRAGGDVDRAGLGRAAYIGPHDALYQPHRIHDFDLSGTLVERQALAGWADGPALVRRRHDRGRQAVPPGERAPAPARAAHRTRPARRHPECRTHRAQ